MGGAGISGWPGVLRRPIFTIIPPVRRRGRVAEGGGLLNRYTVISRIEGSNPSVSANPAFAVIRPPASKVVH